MYFSRAMPRSILCSMITRLTPCSSLTVLFQPQPEVAARVAAWLDELAAIEPAQVFYAPAQVHVTVLSLFTATSVRTIFRPASPTLPCRAGRCPLVTATVYRCFSGVTASPAAVMIQGFPTDDTLERARTALRTSLTAAHLGNELDRRYQLTTAHMTALRLRTPLSASAQFVAQLDQVRAPSILG